MLQETFYCKISTKFTSEHFVQDGPFVWDSIVCNDVTGLFFAGYMVFQLPGGRLAETLGGKRVMTVAMGGVALLSLLIPSAAKLGGHTGYPYYLVIVRIMMGLFEAATFPCITSMLARWAPQSERSTMSTLIMAGSQAGTIVGFFVSGLLVSSDSISTAHLPHSVPPFVSQLTAV